MPLPSACDVREGNAIVGSEPTGNMRLPNPDQLRVDREKIEDYLMNPDHDEGRSKAGFFTRFGFHRDRWGELAAALREHGRNNEVLNRVESPHGERYTVGGVLMTPDG